MNIIGVSYDSTGICFAEKTSRISTNTLYINEFIDLFRTVGVCDIGFSYDFVCGKIIQIYKPHNLQFTMAGKVMKKVDDYLKTILTELSPIYFGEKLIDLIKNKTELPKDMKLGDEHILTGISIEPTQIIVNKTANTIEIIDIVLGLKYWRKDYITGSVLPFTKHEIDFLNNYVSEYISNMCRIDHDHPYNHLKQIFVAQHIAKFIVQNTRMTISGLMKKETPDLDIPLHLSVRETEEVVFGYNHIAIKRISSRIVHEFKFNGTVMYTKHEGVTPTSSIMTKITGLESEGGIHSESSDAKYIQRGLIEHDSGPRYTYVVFDDDSKKCKELKIIYNGVMLKADSFFTDAPTAGQLAIDSYKNYFVLKNYPEQILKYCKPH